MIRYLVKNNLKLMLRNKWVIAVMIAGPVLVIAILSSVFQELLKSYEGVEEFEAGYRVEAELPQDSIEAIKEAAKEAGILFRQYPRGDVKEWMEKDNLAGFVVIGEESYTVYESEDYVVEGITLEYFMNRAMKEGAKQLLQQTIPVAQEEVELPVHQLDYMPAIGAADYYGIVWIVYFIWCGITCATNVLSSEKKNGIDRKYQVSSLSAFKLYFGKWIPAVLTTVIEISIAIAATVLLLDIHWGKLWMSAVLILLTAMAGTSLGLMLYNLFRNLAVTIIALYVSVWFMGFAGGSFETYMFSSLSDTVKNASPMYHVNRALVEYSCMGKSGYTNSSILYLLVVIIICSAIAVCVDGIRKRGRA